LSPGGRGLGATYDDHLRLIGKRVVDFLLVLIELFSQGVTAEERILVQNRRFRSNGAGWPKISGRRGATNHSYSQKTKLNHLLYGIKIWTDLSSVLSKCTRFTDGQTEGQNSHC